MTQEISRPALQARIAGFLYLIVIVTGVFAVYVSSTLVVRGDAAATAANMIASEQLFRLGFAANLIANAAYIAVTAILYVIFKPVNRTLSLLAAFFSLTGAGVAATSMINFIAPLYYLGGADHLAAFETGHVQALAQVSSRLSVLGNTISLMFYGFYCLSLAALVFGSKFLPRFLSLLLALAGAAWLTLSFASFLSPSFARALGAWPMAAGGFGEGLFTLWLMVMGVNAAKWTEQAGAR